MSGRRPVIGVLDEIHPAAMDALSKRAEVAGPGEIEMARSRCDALIVRNSTVTAAAIAASPQLKVIGKHGAGTDNIDVSAAKAAGIHVVSTPGLNSESVADLAVGFALNLARNIDGHSAALRAEAPLAGQERIGYELAELPCGIVGLGAIGSAVARRLRWGFGCEVSALDPGRPDAYWPKGVGRCHNLAELMAASRIVFLHVPLTDETRGMIDEAMLRMMPQGSFLVNCSRGGTVDEVALAASLRKGHLAGAASDVFVAEPPPPDHPLLRCGRFIATPHVGASTNGGLERVGVAIARKVLAALATAQA